VYLSEVNSLGGTNQFLGIAFLVMAGIVVLILAVFVILYFAKIHNKDLYSPDKVKW
jgi:LEM3 (ligand-effect modulator 3) family / CDC50 family